MKPLGPVPVKGLAGAVDVYEWSGRGRPLAASCGCRRGVSPLRRPRHRTRAAPPGARARGGGHGQVVAVVGEPGVGKSRLFWELTHSHRSAGWLILEASSVSYGKATAYLPVIDLLKPYFQIRPAMTPRGFARR